MKKGDFGGYIYFDVSEDLSDFTTLSIEFYRPSGSVVTKTGTLGTENKGTNLINEYMQYQVEQGFLNESGLWKARLIAISATQQRKSDKVSFVIPE